MGKLLSSFCFRWGCRRVYPAALAALSSLQDEFPLISVPLDTWVGRFVRITTPRHKGTTGLVHRTGNGWVNLQTSLGDVAKRAYDLVVIPQSKANISGVLSALAKGELPRGKRYSRGSKGECAPDLDVNTCNTSTKSMKTDSLSPPDGWHRPDTASLFFDAAV